MKRIYYKWLYTSIMTMILVVILSACAKEPINRKIEGHWILENFTILESGEEVVCERIYWGITRVGAMMMDKQGPNHYPTLSALVEYRDNEKTFVLKDIRHGKETATEEQMHPYGLDDANESVFEVIESTHKRMVLESDYARLYLKKF